MGFACDLPSEPESGSSGGMEFRETGLEVERDDGESEAERRRVRGWKRETETATGFCSFIRCDTV